MNFDMTDPLTVFVAMYAAIGAVSVAALLVVVGLKIWHRLRGTVDSNWYKDGI